MGDGERVADRLTCEVRMRDSGGAGDVGSSAIGGLSRDSDTTLLGEQCLTANDLEAGTRNLMSTLVFGWRAT